MLRRLRSIGRMIAAAFAAAVLAGPVPAVAAGPAAAEPPLSSLTLVGPPSPIFEAPRDACDGVDVPDISARAFRDASGEVVLLGMHYRNRAMRGPALDRLKLDCRVVLASGERSDPAAYDDRSWIAATWTEDGARVAALLHHEFQANEHPGRCRETSYLACWYNTITAAASADGGRSFSRGRPPAVVAGAPFRQEVGQGRHRGFFNPSNVVAQGRWRFMFASTTGWDGQEPGTCLFRSDDPFDPGRWRAWTGTAFAAAFPDPYRAAGKPGPACRPLAPFPAGVGAVVRHRGSGVFIAVFMARAEPARGLPESGFYWTTSRDLLAWDVPRLLVAGPTLYDDPCKAAGDLVAYPSLLDPQAQGRNFDDVGENALLTYVTLRREGCTITSERALVRRPLAITVWP